MSWVTGNWMTIDLETTSLDVATAGVVQIGVAGFRSGECLKVQSVLCNPMTEISEEASSVHHIRSEDVASKLPLVAHKDTLINSIRRYDALVGYGIYDFDLLILDRLLGPEWVAARSGVPVIDVLPIVRLNAVSGGWHEKKRHTLCYAAKFFGIEAFGRDHSAGTDAVKTGKLLWHLLSDPSLFMVQKILTIPDNVEVFLREKHLEQTTAIRQRLAKRKSASEGTK